MVEVGLAIVQEARIFAQVSHARAYSPAGAATPMSENVCGYFTAVHPGFLDGASGSLLSVFPFCFPAARTVRFFAGLRVPGLFALSLFALRFVRFLPVFSGTRGRRQQLLVGIRQARTVKQRVGKHFPG